MREKQECTKLCFGMDCESAESNGSGPEQPAAVDAGFGLRLDSLQRCLL